MLTDVILNVAFQVYILQEKLEAKDYELKKLKEMLSQKETTKERDEFADEKKAIYDPDSGEVEA